MAEDGMEGDLWVEPFSLSWTESISDQMEQNNSLCSIFLDPMALYFLFERMEGEVIQKDDFHWISQKNYVWGVLSEICI